MELKGLYPKSTNQIKIKHQIRINTKSNKDHQNQNILFQRKSKGNPMSGSKERRIKKQQHILLRGYGRENPVSGRKEEKGRKEKERGRREKEGRKGAMLTCIIQEDPLPCNSGIVGISEDPNMIPNISYSRMKTRGL